MAAFGISFPKLTLSRSSISKADANVPAGKPKAAPTTATTRTLSLSIKNVPSQPLHYDVSTTTAKKKPTAIATILAIDGESKQLPKNLSVFNELQLDEKMTDIGEKQTSERSLSTPIVAPPLSLVANIDQRPQIGFLSSIDSKEEMKSTLTERRSNHTFTPPTSSLSNQSSSNDLYLALSSISVDLPPLNYALEKFLVDNDQFTGQIVEELVSTSDQESPDRADDSTAPTVDLNESSSVRLEKAQTHERKIHHEQCPSRSNMTKNMKWYVSELRINRPLIYQTSPRRRQEQQQEEQQRREREDRQRRFSHSTHDLYQMYDLKQRPTRCQHRQRTDRPDAITYSTLSLPNWKHPFEHRHHRSSDDLLRLCQHLNNTKDVDDDDDDDEQYQSLAPRTLGRSIGRDDTLIRNESVKKKLFDILNDDELENACLEDMNEEFERLSLTDGEYRPAVYSFSSSSDDALYSSPANELQLPVSTPPPLSSSCHENLSAIVDNTTERCFGRSRLITTSLDEIPWNLNASDQRSSASLLRPSWYTSPSPQWRVDDQNTLASVQKRHFARLDLPHVEARRMLRTEISEYPVRETKYIGTCAHHGKEQMHIGYSLMNTSMPLINETARVFPMIEEKSSNLLMFI